MIDNGFFDLSDEGHDAYFRASFRDLALKAAIPLAIILILIIDDITTVLARYECD